MLAPPFVISESEIDEIVERFSRAMSALTAGNRELAGAVAG
jgi:acetylornithine/succinyldiaminopimelate/putrescine aminotransferase